MLKAFAEGGSEFAEIRTMLAASRDDKERLDRELASMDALPNVLSLHPHVEQAYRDQVEELERALAAPEAQMAAIPRLRAMISPRHRPSRSRAEARRNRGGGAADGRDIIASYQL